MEQSKNSFPDQIICPKCGSILSLDDDEKQGERVICPLCDCFITPEILGKTEIPQSGEALPSGLLSRIGSLVVSPGPVRGKVLFTLAAITVYRVGRHVMIPVINDMVIVDAIRQHSSLSGYSLFSQGISPYLIGSILVLLLSAMLPSLKQLRDGTGPQRRQFDRIIYIGTLLCSTIGAFGTYVNLKNTFVVGFPPVSGEAGSMISYILTSVAAAMFLVWLADRITQHGVANGVAVILFTDVLSYSYTSIRHLFLVASQDTISRESMITLMVIPVALIFLSLIILPGKRPILITRLGGEIKKGIPFREPLSIPIRVMASGIVPFIIAIEIISVVQAYIPLRFNSPSYVIPYLALGIIFSFVFAANTYDPHDIVLRLKRFGYGIAEKGSAEEATSHIDRILFATVLPGVLFMTVLAMLPFIMYSAIGFTSALISKELIVISSIAFTIVQYFRNTLFKNQETLPNRDQDSPVWVSVFSSDILIEGELVRNILADGGIDSRLTDSRVICATGTFAAWEVCRPKYPGIMIHPRLGKGSVEIFVSTDEADKARKFLKERIIPEDKVDQNDSQRIAITT